MRLQPYACLSQSIRLQLSLAIWELGVSAFFTHGIPFADGNCGWVAKKLAELIMSLYQYDNSKPLQFHEVGAGHGLLSRRIIDALSSEQAEHLNLSMFLNDFSTQIISDIERLKVFEDSPFNTECEAKSFDQTLPKGYGMIHCSYLVDSLPAPIIYWDGSELFVKEVQTYLEDSFIALDGCQFPPNIMYSHDILNLCKNGHYEALIGVASRLSRHLTEEYRWIPLAQSSLSVSDRQFTERTLRHLSLVDHCVFSFPIQFYKWLTSLYDSRSFSGIVSVIDFGHSNFQTKHDPEDVHYADYGGCRFQAVNFELLRRFIHSKGGWAHTLRGIEEGSTQWLIMGLQCPDISRKWEGVFDTCVTDSLEAFKLCDDSKLSVRDSIYFDYLERYGDHDTLFIRLIEAYFTTGRYQDVISIVESLQSSWPLELNADLFSMYFLSLTNTKDFKKIEWLLPILRDVYGRYAPLMKQLVNLEFSVDGSLFVTEWFSWWLMNADDDMSLTFILRWVLMHANSRKIFLKSWIHIIDVLMTDEMLSSSKELRLLWETSKSQISLD